MLCQEVCLWYQGLQGLGHQVLWTQTLQQMQAPLLRQEMQLWNQSLQGIWHQVLWTQTLYRMQAPLLRQEMRLRNQGLQSHRCQKVLRRQEVKMSSLDSYKLAHHHRALL